MYGSTTAPSGRHIPFPLVYSSPDQPIQPEMTLAQFTVTTYQQESTDRNQDRLSAWCFLTLVPRSQPSHRTRGGNARSSCNGSCRQWRLVFVFVCLCVCVFVCLVCLCVLCVCVCVYVCVVWCGVVWCGVVWCGVSVRCVFKIFVGASKIWALPPTPPSVNSPPPDRPPPDPPKCRSFFSLPDHNILSFFPLLGFLSLNFGGVF